MESFNAMTVGIGNLTDFPVKFEPRNITKNESVNVTVVIIDRRDRIDIIE